MFFGLFEIASLDQIWYIDIVPKKREILLLDTSLKLVRFAHNWSTGVMEYWSNGFGGIRNSIVAFATQYSNTPVLHVNGINRLLLKDV